MFDPSHWDDFAGRDLSGVSTFVFGVTGTPEKIRMKFEDTNFDKTAFTLLGVTNTMQFYHIQGSLVSNATCTGITSMVKYYNFNMKDGQAACLVLVLQGIADYLVVAGVHGNDEIQDLRLVKLNADEQASEVDVEVDSPPIRRRSFPSPGACCFCLAVFVLALD